MYINIRPVLELPSVVWPIFASSFFLYFMTNAGVRDSKQILSYIYSSHLFPELIKYEIAENKRPQHTHIQRLWRRYSRRKFSKFELQAAVWLRTWGFPPAEKVMTVWSASEAELERCCNRTKQQPCCEVVRLINDESSWVCRLLLLLTSSLLLLVLFSSLLPDSNPAP